ncbi:MAG: hypothetical protein ACPLPT_01270 [Moorellales bacterium]
MTEAVPKRAGYGIREGGMGVLFILKAVVWQWVIVGVVTLVCYLLMPKEV